MSCGMGRMQHYDFQMLHAILSATIKQVLTCVPLAQPSNSDIGEAAQTVQAPFINYGRHPGPLLCSHLPTHPHTAITLFSQPCGILATVARTAGAASRHTSLCPAGLCGRRNGGEGRSRAQRTNDARALHEGQRGCRVCCGKGTAMTARRIERCVRGGR